LQAILFCTLNGHNKRTAPAGNISQLFLQRVPSAASGTGNAQFFVWRVKNTYREHYIDHLYHAALNLRQMVNCMAELLLEGTKDETKLRNRKNILILALTRHDESLMVFHDF